MQKEAREGSQAVGKRLDSGLETTLGMVEDGLREGKGCPLRTLL